MTGGGPSRSHHQQRWRLGRLMIGTLAAAALAALGFLGLLRRGADRPVVTSRLDRHPGSTAVSDREVWDHADEAAPRDR